MALQSLQEIAFASRRAIDQRVGETRASRPRSRMWLKFAVECLLLGTLLAAGGCSTHANRVREAHEHFYAGRVDEAAESYRAQVGRRAGDTDVLRLNLALVDLVSGRPREAEQALRVVRDEFDHLEQVDLAEVTLSMLTDDQQLAYDGEDYEKVLARVFLALSNLMHDGGDAEAYSLQINAKQNELLHRAGEQQVENVEAAYTPLAIGPYLRGMLREATHANYDDAQQAYAQVVSWQPNFRSGQHDLRRASEGVHSQPGHGVLYVFALVDRGPVKEQALEIPTSQAMLVADRIVSALGEYDVPPTLAAIKVPRVVVPPKEVDHVQLFAGDSLIGQTEVICDVADLAFRQQEAQFPHVMGRAVARRVIKKAAVYAAKDGMEVESPWTDLAMSAVGVAWEATEAADTRCWGLLPREIQVLRIELPAGQHKLQLRRAVRGQVLGVDAVVDVEVLDGRNSYLLGYFTGQGIIGRLVHNTP